MSMGVESRSDVAGFAAVAASRYEADEQAFINSITANDDE